jgi:hypothetical protein
MILKKYHDNKICIFKTFKICLSTVAYDLNNENIPKQGKNELDFLHVESFLVSSIYML